MFKKIIAVAVMLWDVIQGMRLDISESAAGTANATEVWRVDGSVDAVRLIVDTSRPTSVFEAWALYTRLYDDVFEVDGPGTYMPFDGTSYWVGLMPSADGYVTGNSWYVDAITKVFKTEEFLAEISSAIDPTNMQQLYDVADALFDLMRELVPPEPRKAMAAVAAIIGSDCYRTAMTPADSRAAYGPGA